jgi:hypothetical protein
MYVLREEKINKSLQIPIIFLFQNVICLTKMYLHLRINRLFGLSILIYSKKKYENIIFLNNKQASDIYI